MKDAEERIKASVLLEVNRDLSSDLLVKMVDIVEGQHQLPDGHKLYTKIWKPDNSPKAQLIFVHGYSDHCNRYHTLFPTLASHSIRVFAFDQRGWGRSVHTPSQKGLTGSTTLVLSDLSHIITTQLSLHPSLPAFVMGHSMGGAEVLTLASSIEHYDLTGSIRGWIIESAHLAFTPMAKPSAIEIYLGRILSTILPNLPLHRPVPPTSITPNPIVQASLTTDPLCHNTGTLQCLSCILDRAHNLHTGKMRLNKNVRALWMGHGTGDQVSEYEACERFFGRQGGVGDKVWCGYGGWGHQLHSEVEAGRFVGDVVEWVLGRCDGGGMGEMVEV